MFSSKLLASVCLAIAVAGVSAFTSHDASKFATHRVRHIGRGLKVEAFHPKTTYETFGVSGATFAKRAGSTVKESTIALVEEKTGVSADAIKLTSTAQTDTGSVAYVRQQHNGVKFANAVANAAFNKNNKVVAFGSSFVKPDSIASSTPKISQDEAIKVAVAALGGAYNKKPIGLEYVVKADNTAVLTHVVEVQDDAANTWFEAFVDAATGELVSVTDFVAQATYRVLPIWKEYPTDGLETLVNPEDKVASPYGWLSTDGVNFNNFTAGNNAIAAIWADTAPATAADEFVYPYAVGEDVSTASQKRAAIVNAFYVVNTVHDISYRYGFTEATFNFQKTNIAHAGMGNDRVVISVQDSVGVDNAYFSTPADGSAGRMVMFMWDYFTPLRDGSLENDIVAHEMTHGITNRMTGGGTSRCLQTQESAGMGEGWSDAMASWLEKTSAAVPDYEMGLYVYGENIRSYPYSTSATVNPLRYSSIAALNEVHNIGEVWANMLHNVYAALVNQHGWDAKARTDPTVKTGNAVFLHLFMDSLLLQPCNPTFVSARDAWIQADANRYAGVNKCLLWKAFASRGLGVGAADYVDSSAVPEECTGQTTTTSSSSSTATSSTVSSSMSSSATQSSPASTIVESSTIVSSTSASSTTASPSPAPGCVDPKCPVDLTGSTGTLITKKPTLFTCAYATGSCTWYLPEGVLRNTAQPNCPKTVTC